VEIDVVEHYQDDVGEDGREEPGGHYWRGAEIQETGPGAVWAGGSVLNIVKGEPAGRVAAAAEQENFHPALLRDRLYPPPTSKFPDLEPARLDRRAVAVVKPTIQIQRRVLQKHGAHVIGVFFAESLVDF
jgi:hypothetical protein